MKVLVAIDGSEHSELAVRTVESRPWPNGTVVRVLSVVAATLPPPPPPAWSSLDFESYRSQQTAEANALVQRAAGSLSSAGLQSETAVRTGDPRIAIVEEAEEWSADLIVMGSRGLTGVKSWLLGSVAQKVVRYAPCSVEVVRHKTERAGT